MAPTTGTALLHAPDLCRRHDRPDHAENARRLDAFAPPTGLVAVAPRPATDAELLAVHARSHLDVIADGCAAGGGMLDPDTYCGPESEAVARAVCGGVIDLALSVWRGAVRNGMAVVRPPGHHATRDRVMGFCLYNHIAAAAAAVRRDGAGRVAVLDFDVHHGNGTQDIFAADPTVFFASSHQFPHYPGTGRADETGTGPGTGFTLNVPLTAGAGDAELLSAWRATILPRVREFAPEMILVSAGYDAHRADPLAGLEVTTAGFGALVGMLLATAADGSAAGRVAFVLEGGYDPTALVECVAATLDLLRGA